MKDTLRNKIALWGMVGTAGIVMFFAILALILGLQIGVAWLFAHPVLWVLHQAFPDVTFNQTWIGIFVVFFVGNCIRSSVTIGKKD